MEFAILSSCAVACVVGRVHGDWESWACQTPCSAEYGSAISTSLPSLIFVQLRPYSHGNIAASQIPPARVLLRTMYIQVR